MVLPHLLRCQRYLWRGLCDRLRVSKLVHGVAPFPADSPATSVVPLHAVRAIAADVAARGSGGSAAAPTFVWPWRRRLPADPAFGFLMAQPVTISVYCGLRMIDELGHVNNAKYLEITEFARWHQLAFLGLGNVMVARKVAFVVSDLSITYQREIGPCKTVWVRTRFLLPPAEQSTTTTTTATSAASSATDKKRFFIEHELWSADGQKLHAALTLAAALIGPVSYERELLDRYGSEAQKAAYVAPSRPRTTLDCERVLADVAGFATTTELRSVFDSVAKAEAATSSTGAAERADRIGSLAHVWKNSRNELRSQTLTPKTAVGKKE